MEARRERACAFSLLGIHRAGGRAQLRIPPLRMGRGVLGESGASYRPLPSPDAPGGLRDGDGPESRKEKGECERPRQPGFPGERALPASAGHPARATAAPRGTGEVAAAVIDHEDGGPVDFQSPFIGVCVERCGCSLARSRRVAFDICPSRHIISTFGLQHGVRCSGEKATSDEPIGISNDHKSLPREGFRLFSLIFK